MAKCVRGRSWAVSGLTVGLTGRRRCTILERVRTAGASLNYVDLLILLIVGLSALNGLRSGFVRGLLHLVGLVVTLVVATSLYRPIGAALASRLEWPLSVAHLAAFVGALLIVQALYWLVVTLFFVVLRPPEPVARVLRPVDRFLGVVPGGVRGALYAAFLLFPFASFPLIPGLTAEIQASSLGSILVTRAAALVGELNIGLGADLEGGLGFLAPPQREHERVQLPFKASVGLRPEPDTEQRMLELVNKERAALGLKSLTFDPELVPVARAHGVEMFQLGYFGHESPVTGTPFDRMRAAGVRYVAAGENLAYAPNLEIAHEGLMNSPGHRANILHPSFGRLGVGVVRSSGLGKMFVQLFRN